MTSIIEVKGLVRDFTVAEKESGSFGRIRSLLSMGGSQKRVVDHLNFQIREGEFVGYLGPNGAGKSTTIKMLSGVLVPTAGNVFVGGIEPHKQRIKHAQHIGVVFGQRTQLWWDLPLIESFKLLGSIYKVPAAMYKRNLDLFTDILEMDRFLNTPVRQLSLGQRMRGDIAASLMHDPKVLFLDEPTIGLDIIAKEKIQQFLKAINEEKKITIILTTHNLDDIERLCKRVIFIDQGRILFDGSTPEMITRFGDQRYLVVETGTWNKEKWTGPVIERVEENKLWFRIENNGEVASLIRRVCDLLPVLNLSVVEPRIEDIIKQLYQLREQPEVS